MKLPPFDYHRAESVDDAVHCLAGNGGDAKPLAGGQSLLPLMAFRLAWPRLLVDLSAVAELSGVQVDGPCLTIGAMSRHRDLAETMLPPGYRVINRTAPLIGHEPIRTLGTFGGSVAHADPAAEWCSVLLALDGTVIVRSASQTREVPADAFFTGFFQTAIGEDELILGVRFDRPRPCSAVREFALRRGDFAIVLMAVAFDRLGGRCVDPRIVAGGVGETPLRLTQAESIIDGTDLDDAVLVECGRVAANSIDPPTDIRASSDRRRQLIRSLTVAALREALIHGQQAESMGWPAT